MRESFTRAEAMQLTVEIDGQSTTIGALSDAQFVEYLRRQVLEASPENGEQCFEEAYGSIDMWDPHTRWWALDNLKEIRRKAILRINSKKYYAKSRKESA